MTGLDLEARAAVTDDAHQELAKAIVQFLDVGEHAHGRIVLTGGAGVHAAGSICGYCMERRQAMKRKSQTRAGSFANQLRRSKRFRAVQSRPVVGPSASDIAAICHLSIATAKRWLSYKTRIPRYAVLLISGDLGAINPDWKGWRLEKDTIISPKRLVISREEVEAAPALKEEIAILREELAAVRCKSLEEQPRPEPD